MSTPTNTVGAGNIAGSGGVGGEPGVSPSAANRYKNKNEKEAPGPITGMAKRKTFREFLELYNEDS